MHLDLGAFASECTNEVKRREKRDGMTIGRSSWLFLSRCLPLPLSLSLSHVSKEDAEAQCGSSMLGLRRLETRGSYLPQQMGMARKVEGHGFGLFNLVRICVTCNRGNKCAR